MLMSAIDNAASNISVCSTSRALWCQPLKYLKESSNMVPSVLRLDVLIEVIRGEFAIINIASCCAHVIKLSGTLRLFTKPCCLWRAWLVWHQNLCYTMLCPFSPSWGPMSSIVMTPIVSGWYRRSVHLLDFPAGLIEKYHSDNRRYCARYGRFPQKCQYWLLGSVYRLKRFSSSVYGCCEPYTTPSQK